MKEKIKYRFENGCIAYLEYEITTTPVMGGYITYVSVFDDNESCNFHIDGVITERFNINEFLKEKEEYLLKWLNSINEN